MRRPTLHDPVINTVAILGDSPVVSRAVAHLLEVGGYQTKIIQATPDEAALADVVLVLVAAGIDPGSWRLLNLEGAIPVLKLVDTPEEKESAGDGGILWPCTARELQSGVSSAIDLASVEAPVKGNQKPHG